MEKVIEDAFGKITDLLECVGQNQREMLAAVSLLKERIELLESVVKFPDEQKPT